MSETHHEQLSTTGVGSSTTGDSGSGSEDPPQVRVVPIGEGDITEGLSGERAYWSRDVLQDAVESGALDGAKIIKGQAGSGHKDSVSEQAAPEDIIGRVDSWSYEEGVGPVGESVVVDDQMADRIEHGLLDVSPDLYRRLGNYDDDLEAKPVDEILSMPYITVLDRGASQAASIEPATAEALGYNPEGENQLMPENQDESDQDEHSEQLASAGDAVRWESSSGGSREPDSVRYGVVVDNLQDEEYGEDELLVAVYQPDSDYEDWESRNEENVMSDDNLERVGGNGVDSLPAISQVVDSGEEQNADGASTDGSTSDELAGSSTGPERPDTTMGDDKLREQLSDAQSRVSELEDTKEQLADKNDDLAEQLSEAEEERDELADEKEDLEEELGSIREDFEPIKEFMAQLAVGDSAMDAEKVAEKFDGEDIIEMLADEEDDRDPVEQVQEQLGAGVAPRGDSDSGGEGDSSSPENYSEEQLAEANERAHAVMRGSDVIEAQQSGLSPREYVKDRKGVDPAQYGSTHELEQAFEQQSEQNANAAQSGGD
jgi:hypothetical protein